MKKGLENVIKKPGSKSGNYASKVSKDTLEIYLFENCIAYITDKKVELTHCGWYTSTTSHALKALERYYVDRTVKYLD